MMDKILKTIRGNWLLALIATLLMLGAIYCWILLIMWFSVKGFEYFGMGTILLLTCAYFVYSIVVELVKNKKNKQG